LEAEAELGLRNSTRRPETENKHYESKERPEMEKSTLARQQSVEETQNFNNIKHFKERDVRKSTATSQSNLNKIKHASNYLMSEGVKNSDLTRANFENAGF